MFLKYFFTGFALKIIASIDDAFTRIPIISALAQTRIGKIAFSIGTLLSLLSALGLALAFSQLLAGLENAKYWAAGLIIVIALVIYFDLFSGKKRAHMTKKRQHTLLKHPHPDAISRERFLKLLLVGFVITFITVVDDTVVFIPLFLNGWTNTLYVISGIVVATIIQIILVIYFAERIDKIKYKKEISTVGLIVVALLILFGVL